MKHDVATRVLETAFTIGMLIFILFYLKYKLAHHTLILEIIAIYTCSVE